MLVCLSLLLVSYAAGDDDKDATFAKEIVTTELETVVDGLVNAAKYSVSVSAFVADYELTRDKHGNIIIYQISQILYSIKKNENVTKK